MNEEPFGPLALISRFSTLRRRGRGSQPPAVRPRVLRLHEVGQDRERDRRRGRSRHDVDQPLGLALPEVPFGGVKDSGYGSEGGTEAIEAYLNTKFVTQTGV